MGIDHPCAGGIFESRIHSSPARVRAADYVSLKLECELAFRLGIDLPPGRALFDAARMRGAVESIMPAFEDRPGAGMVDAHQFLHDLGRGRDLPAAERTVDGRRKAMEFRLCCIGLVDIGRAQGRRQIGVDGAAPPRLPHMRPRLAGTCVIDHGSSPLGSLTGTGS